MIANMNLCRSGLATSLHRGAVMACVLCLGACSGAKVAVPRTAALDSAWVRYEGIRISTGRGVGAVPHLDGLPPGAQILGVATASCRAEFPRGAHFVTRLGNLDCSPKRLVEGVEEVAREVGGASLWQLDCRRMGQPQATRPKLESPGALDANPQRNAEPGERLECTANVVGSPPGAIAAPAAPLASALSRADAVLSFDAVAAESLPSPRPAAVEVPYLPVADRSLGLLRASLEPGATLGMTESEVRTVMAEAAGRLGASHLVTPACWESVQACGRLTAVVCQAVVSAPLLDPRVTTEAR